MANPFDEDIVVDDRTASHANTSEVLLENVSYSAIAAKLIADNYLLTALELHTELIEAGREVSKLREFFSNPGNFEQQAAPTTRLDVSSSIRRSSSQATLDSLDFARYSEDGERGTDERVAVLEFELRKAKETISALRTNLTVAAESESTTPDQGSAKSVKNDTIKPHEQRALNFLLNEYLLLHNYKLTSITFADENEDQDFEDWDDVGLNIPKPAELLNVYRDFLRQTGHSRSPCQDASCQTDLSPGHEPVQPWEDATPALPEQETTPSPPETTPTALETPPPTLETPPLTLETTPPPPDDSERVSELLREIARLKEAAAGAELEAQELRRLWTAERGAATRGAGVGDETPSAESATPERFELIEADGDAEWTRVAMPGDNAGLDTPSVTDGSSSSTEPMALPTELSPALPTALATAALPEAPPTAFQQQVFARCFLSTTAQQEKHGLDQMLRQEITEAGLVLILGESLPRIIPNIILNKRDEVLVLIVATIHLHPSPGQRDRLLHLLFNLKKRPQQDERLMILAAVVTVARCSGPSLAENEILPQCWEQIAHRHVERRLLVAEACSALLPFVSSPIRNSLVLSMLQQMLLEDASDEVRATAVRSLALTVALVADADKYAQCEQLALTAIQDPAPAVVAASLRLLLPVLAKWASDLGRLRSHLFARLLDQLNTRASRRWVDAVERVLPFAVVEVACGEGGGVAGEEVVEGRTGGGLADPGVFYEGEAPLGAVMAAFWRHVGQEYYEEWPELEWLLNTFVPRVLDAVEDADAADDGLVDSLVALFRRLCEGLGAAASRAKVRPQFAVRLQKLEKSLAGGRAGSEGAAPSLAIIPVYIVGVLAAGKSDADELTSTLKRFLFGLPLCGCPLAALSASLRGLCSSADADAAASHQEAVAAALWDAVVHPRPVVRHAAAGLVAGVAAAVAESVLNGRLVPALLTLSSDTDTAVRTAGVAALGSLASASHEARDKTCVQLQTLLADPATRESHGLLIQLVVTMGVVVAAAEPWFREEVILPHLAAMAAYAQQLSNLTKRLDLANALVEAFSRAVYCSLSKQCVTGSLLPGLRCLEPVCATSLRNHHDTVLTMMASAESRADVHRSGERSNSLAAATANVNQGVEDMKKRVSNIFTGKPGGSSGLARPANLPNLQAIFRKK